VTGASGLLGRAILAAFRSDAAAWRVCGAGFSRAREGLVRLDLCDPAAVEACLESLRPRVVIHSAAERRPDVSEDAPEATRRLNVEATGRLARWCATHGAWMLYLSTDYVFDGSRPPYGVGDPTGPLNAYGRSKRDGEIALRDATADAAVLRVPILYGPCETLAESSVTSIVAALLRATPAAPLRLDHWAVRYPTHTADVASVIRQMTLHRLAGHPLAGVFHASGNEPHTKYTLGLLMARILGVDAEALRPDDAPTSGAPRPRDAHLDTSRLDALGITARTPLEPALREILAHARP
jgi:dTDP-4-dehydrorhamnose reductase